MHVHHPLVYVSQSFIASSYAFFPISKALEDHSGNLTVRKHGPHSLYFCGLSVLCYCAPVILLLNCVASLMQVTRYYTALPSSPMSSPAKGVFSETSFYISHDNNFCWLYWYDHVLADVFWYRCHIDVNSRPGAFIDRAVLLVQLAVVADGDSVAKRVVGIVGEQEVVVVEKLVVDGHSLLLYVEVEDSQVDRLGRCW